jgi:predicted membrane protein
MTYFGDITNQLGVSLWLLVVILIWSVVWKLLALWKSARKNHVVWFIVLAIVNTVGILEILYIYVFSEMTMKNKAKKTEKEQKAQKPAAKKRRR